MRRTAALWLSVPLFVISAALAIFGVYLMIHVKVGENEQSRAARKDLDTLESRINVYYEVYQEKMNKVRDLVNAHEFRQAAILLEDLTATKRMLVTSEKRYSPSPDEREALRYMKEAGCGEIYSNYLRLLYPWTSEDEDASKQQP